MITCPLLFDLNVLFKSCNFSLSPHLVLLVAEAAPLWSQTQLLRCQPVGVVAQAGDGHGRHQDAADAGHGHQRGEHHAGAGLDTGRHGQRFPIIPLWSRKENESAFCAPS